MLYLCEPQGRNKSQPGKGGVQADRDACAEKGNNCESLVTVLKNSWSGAKSQHYVLFSLASLVKQKYCHSMNGFYVISFNKSMF